MIMPIGLSIYKLMLGLLLLTAAVYCVDDSKTIFTRITGMVDSLNGQRRQAISFSDLSRYGDYNPYNNSVVGNLGAIGEVTCESGVELQVSTYSVVSPYGDYLPYNVIDVGILAAIGEVNCKMDECLQFPINVRLDHQFSPVGIIEKEYNKTLGHIGIIEAEDFSEHFNDLLYAYTVWLVLLFCFLGMYWNMYAILGITILYCVPNWIIVLIICTTVGIASVVWALSVCHICVNTCKKKYYICRCIVIAFILLCAFLLHAVHCQCGLSYVVGVYIGLISALFSGKVQHQAGYLPKDNDDRAYFIDAFTKTKFSKRNGCDYTKVLEHIRRCIVLPAAHERCVDGNNLLCVFKLGSKNYLLKFPRTRRVYNLNDAFALLTHEIVMVNTRGNISHQGIGILSAIGLAQDDRFEDVLYTIYLCTRFWQTHHFEHLYALFRVIRSNSKEVFNKSLWQYFVTKTKSLVVQPEHIDWDAILNLTDFGEEENQENTNIDEEAIKKMKQRVDAYKAEHESAMRFADEAIVDHIINASNIEHQSLGMSDILGTLHSIRSTVVDKGFVSFITLFTGLGMLLMGSNFHKSKRYLSAHTGLITEFLTSVHGSADFITNTPRTIIEVVTYSIEYVQALYNSYIAGDKMLTYADLDNFSKMVMKINKISLDSAVCPHKLVDIADDKIIFSFDNTYHLDGKLISYSELTEVIHRQYNLGLALSHKFKANKIPTWFSHLKDRFVIDFAIMELIYNRLVKEQSANSTRHTPFSALVFGESGIGKSRIIDHLIDVAAQVTGVPNEGKYIFTVQDGQKYWNGFKSYMHTIIFDDLGAAKTTTFDPGSPLALVLRVVNDILFVPDQAAVEDKGNHLCQPIHVIGSSNFKNLNVHTIMTHPAATLRRFPLVITPTVKEKYRVPDGVSLDISKTTDAPDDYHTFLVETCIVSKDDPKNTNNLANVSYLKMNYVDSNGVVRIRDGECNSLVDLKIVYAEMVDKHYKTVWQKKNKFSARCEKHSALLPCHKCKMLDEGHIVTQMGRGENINDEPEMVVAPFAGVEAYIRRPNFIRRCIDYIRYNSVTMHIYIKFWTIVSSLGLVYLVTNTICWVQSFIIDMRTSLETMNNGYIGLRDTCIDVLTTVDDSIERVKTLYVAVAPLHYAGRFFNHWQKHRVKYYGILSIGFIGLLVILLRSLKTFSVVTQQVYTNDKGVAAPPNPWNSHEAVHVGGGSQCNSRKNFAQGYRHLKNRCVVLTTDSKIGTTVDTARGFLLASNIILTVRHFIDGKYNSDRRVRVNVITDDGCSKSTIVTTAEVLETKPGNDNDIAVLLLDSAIFNCTDISGCTQNHFFFDDVGKVKHIYNPMCFGDTEIPFTTYLSGSDDFNLYKYDTPHLTVPGQSGSPIFGMTMSDQPVFLGLHVGVDSGIFSTSPVFNYVNRRNMSPFFRRIRAHTISVDVKRHAQVELQIGHNSLLGKKSPEMERDDDGEYPIVQNAVFYGTVKGVRQAIGSTNFFISDISEHVEAFASEHNIILDKLPPTRNSLLNRGFTEKEVSSVNKSWPSVNHWYRSIKSICPLTTVEKLQLCSKVLFSQVVKNISGKLDKYKEYVRPLDLVEAINGVSDDPLVGSLDFTTSTGYPFFTKKHMVMEWEHGKRVLSNEQFNTQGCCYPTLSPQADYEDTLQCFKDSVRPGKFFVSRYKDECIKPTKLVERGRRLFMNGPLSLTLIVRQYYLMFITFLKIHARDFYTVYGINATSRAWGTVYDKLNEKRFWNDGDFTAFDVNISAELLHNIVTNIIIPLVRLSPHYSDVDDKFLKNILLECYNAQVCIDGDMFILNGMNPSGNPLTTIFNCFANVIYHMIAYGDILGYDKLEQFFIDVNIYTYGDDSVYTTDLPQFNCVNIGKALAAYGVKYTNSKKQIGLEFTPKEDIVLLQRSFVKRGDIVFAPLAKSSILRSFFVDEHTRANSKERWQGVVNSAWYESFQFEDEFGVPLRNFIKSICELKQLECIDVSYTQWLERYERDSLPWLEFHDEFLDS